MPSANLEIMQRALDDFAKVQRRMILAKKENATETYEDLKNIKGFAECVGCKPYRTRRDQGVEFPFICFR